MKMEIDWNMSGEPEWRDEMPQDQKSQQLEFQVGSGTGALSSLNPVPKSEFWILRRTLDGWRLVSERPVGSKTIAADNIRVMSPGTYKILETVGAYKSEIELLPFTEN